MGRYMKIILMYDLNMGNPDQITEYNKFHKWIVKRGYLMLQYSLYYKTINAISKYEYEQIALIKAVPSQGNVRCMIITDRQFYEMKLLRGNKHLNEKINNSERYIKIDENIWK